MEAKLPADIDLTVRAALERYPDWSGVDREESLPSIVRLVGDQSNNLSVLVANSRSYVVRVNRRDASANAVEPLAEQAAIRQASDARLAPTLRYFDAELGVSVCDYLAPDSESRGDVAPVAALLRAIHRLDPVPYRLRLSERINFYIERVSEERNSCPKRETVLRALEPALKIAIRLYSADRSAVLCHNDLLGPNRLWSDGRLWAIDWEYAATGSLWFDLAVVIHGDRLSPAAESDFIKAYLGRDPTLAERQLLNWAGECYLALASAWYLLNSR